jgi:hypothetical protein
MVSWREITLASWSGIEATEGAGVAAVPAASTEGVPMPRVDETRADIGETIGTGSICEEAATISI